MLVLELASEGNYSLCLRQSGIWIWIEFVYSDSSWIEHCEDYDAHNWVCLEVWQFRLLMIKFECRIAIPYPWIRKPKFWKRFFSINWYPMKGSTFVCPPRSLFWINYSTLTASFWLHFGDVGVVAEHENNKN